MKAKLIIPISLVLIVISLIPTASAQAVVAYIYGYPLDANYNYATQAFEVPQGQMIKFIVTVSVAPDSPVPLDGFWLVVWLTKPSRDNVVKYFDFTNVYIGIGKSEIISLKTGVVADEIGTWSYKIWLFGKDRKQAYAYTSGTFNVVVPATPTPTPTPAPKPKAEVTVNEVAGYTALAGMFVAAIYLILSRIRG